MQVFFFKEGYIRTSSESYDLNNIQDLYIHLTNNAIQKNSEKYGKIEDGNQMSFKQFQKYLKDAKINLNFREKILLKMKDLIRVSTEAVQGKMNPNNRKFCFEIFGYDFIID